MRLLVTGGLGFIGSNFIRSISINFPNYEIINIGKIGICANPDDLKDLKNEDRYNFIKGDMSNPETADNFI